MACHSRDLLLGMCNASDVETLWRLHCERMAEYGFDRLLYGFTRFCTSTSLGDPNDFIVLSNHTEAYVRGFVESGLFRHAPMAGWALENEGHASWREGADRLANGQLGEKARKVKAFNRAHHVEAGYTISFRSVSSRSKGAISLAARVGLDQDAVDAIWDQHGPEILLQNNIAHMKIQTLPVPLPRQSLTPRQREALEWVSDGKTTQDIAQIMGLTAATVEKHLRLARDTLNVETTAQAVAKAAFHNQIHILSVP